jgi:hypothetical protein
MLGSRLNTKNRVSLKIAVLKIVMHAAVRAGVEFDVPYRERKNMA